MYVFYSMIVQFLTVCFKWSWKQHNVKFFNGEIGSTYLDFFPAPRCRLAGSPDSFCSCTSAHARKISVKKVVVVANAKTVWWYRAQQNTTGCFETNRKFESYIIKSIIHKKKDWTFLEYIVTHITSYWLFMVAQRHRDHILTDNFCYPCELLSLWRQIPFFSGLNLEQSAQKHAAL